MESTRRQKVGKTRTCAVRCARDSWRAPVTQRYRYRAGLQHVFFCWFLFESISRYDMAMALSPSPPLPLGYIVVWKHAKKLLYGQSALSGSSLHINHMARSSTPPRLSPRSAHRSYGRSMIAPLRYSNPRTIPPGLLIRSANLHLNGSIIKREGKKETKEMKERKKAVEGLSGKKDADPITRCGVGSGSDLSVYGARNQINATTRHRRRPFGRRCAATIMPLELLLWNRHARDICAEALSQTGGLHLGVFLPDRGDRWS